MIAQQFAKRVFNGRSLDILTIVLLPFVLVVLNNSWIFVKPMFEDRWVYSGLQLHLHALLERYSYTYYASRAPWNLLGWAAHRAFGPEMALYVLHFFVFYVAIFSLYFAVLTIFSNRLAALSAALLLAVQSYFLVASGWDYVDGAYTACLLLSIAALAAVAVGSRWQIAALVWGGAVAVVVSLHIFLVVLLPVELVMFVALNRLAERRRVIAVAARFLVGGAVTVLVVGWMNWLAGGPFLYLLAQVAYMPEVAVNRSRWFQQLGDWVWIAPWLLIPVAAVVFCIAAAVRLGPSALRQLRSSAQTFNLDARVFVACVSCLAAFLVFVVLEADHFYPLQYSDKVNALLPFVFIVIGGTLTATAEKSGKGSEAVLAIVVIAISLVPWILSGRGIGLTTHDYLGPISEIAWVILGSLALVSSFVTSRLGFVAITLFISTAGFGDVALDNPMLRFSQDPVMMTSPPDPFYKQATLAVFDASKEITQYNPDASARFWYNARDPLGALEADVNFTYLAAYTLISESFPSLTSADGTQAAISPGDRIILLPRGTDPIPQANAALASHGVMLRPVAYRQVHRPGVTLSFVVADAELDPRKHRSELPISARWPLVARIPSLPWAYAAILPLPRYHGRGDASNAIVRIRTRDARGDIWIGVLRRDGKVFIDRKTLSEGPQERETMFAGIALKDASDIIIQNGPSGKSGSVTIESASVLVPIVDPR